MVQSFPPKIPIKELSASSCPPPSKKTIKITLLIYRIGKSIETENTSVLDEGWRAGEWGGGTWKKMVEADCLWEWNFFWVMKIF